MNRTFRLMLAIIVAVSLMVCNMTISSALSSINITINPLTISINGKVAKIDNFLLSGKYYVQLQDVCSALGIDYTYMAKTKTIAVLDKKPAKALPLAKQLFSSIKAGTAKALSVQVSPYILKINNRAVKLTHYVSGTNIYFAANELAQQLNRDFVINATTKTMAITDKKPTLPTFKPSTTAVTEQDVVMTIENWGNAVKKEYKIDEGNWLPYTKPVNIPFNSMVYARGTNAANIQSDIAKFEIRNIHKLRTKVDISKLNKWAVKILYYDINGVELGNGSGIIVSPDGKIVTNYHVIDMIPKLKVVTYDNKIYDVKGITAYDDSKDLAVIKIDAKDLPFAILGSSDNIQLGEDIVAIGYPTDGVTVTFGNISSVTASPGAYRNSDHDIQITAALNPGNSGGPLLNMYGEVIGVNYSTKIGAQNMNYSIPINEVKPLLASNAIKTFEKVISEVYPVMTESQYAYYLFYNYPTFKTGDYSFNMYDIFLTTSEEYPDLLYVEVDLSGFMYGDVLLAELDGNKAAVEKWTDDIYQKVKAKFPNKNVSIYLCFSDSFSSMPSGYATDEINYNQNTGLYDVFKIKLIYGYENGQPTSQWY